ncbi:MAG: hypothetical protein ACXWYC_11580 [Actinomycetota bacterium]
MRRFASVLLAVLLAVLPVATDVDRAGAGGADLILHGGVVLTMDPEIPTAAAIALSGRRILAVGNDDDVLALAGPGTTVIDLEGMAVTPGFIDSHGHWIGDRELYEVSSAEDAIKWRSRADGPASTSTS